MVTVPNTPKNSDFVLSEAGTGLWPAQNTTTPTAPTNQPTGGRGTCLPGDGFDAAHGEVAVRKLPRAAAALVEVEVQELRGQHEVLTPVEEVVEAHDAVQVIGVRPVDHLQELDLHRWRVCVSASTNRMSADLLGVIV